MQNLQKLKAFNFIVFEFTVIVNVKVFCVNIFEYYNSANTTRVVQI